jgi:predicted Zn-dependent protease
VSSFWLRGVTLLLLAGPLVAQAPTPDRKQIAEWIKELGARQFNKRAKAEQKLFEAGAIAEDALREALKSEDPEIKRRSQDILNKFKWGIYPTTPKKVVELIEQYQASEQPGKLNIVQKLFDHGSAGCAALLKLIAAEDSEDVRRELHQIISREAGRAIPVMAAEGNRTVLESLLELTLNSDRAANLPNYTAFHLLQGTLDARIAHFKKLADNDKEKEQANETLFYLYRAKGNVQAAKDAAEKARRPALVLGLLEEHAMWKELASREFPMEERQEVERLGYRAAYQRLAGNEKALAEVAEAIRKFARDLEVAAPDRWNAAKTLFLNARPDDGLALIGTGWTAQSKVEILVAQMKYTEALGLVEQAAANAANVGQPREIYDILRARTLYFLGKRDEGRKLFASIADKVKPGQEFTWYDNLVDAALRVGLKEEAFDYCARALATTEQNFTQVRLLKKLFPGQEETAQPWWNVLRKRQASEQALVSMKSLRKLLDGGIKAKELAGLISDLEQTLASRPTEAHPEGQRQWLQAAGEVALKAGDAELAKTYFEKAAKAGQSQTPLIRWGDHLADQKRWTDAAEVYASAWEKQRGEPLALYLRGWALVQAGQKKDGERLMEQSHWLLLGSGDARLSFARALAVRGQAEASKRERELLLKSAALDSFSLSEAMRLNAVDALKERKYLEAATWQEASLLYCNRTFISFVDAPLYVGVPHFIHLLRARGLVAAGKFDEAKVEIDFCESVMPGNVELAIRLMPLLEKQGRKKEAEALYQRMREFTAKQVKQYPESAGLLNSLAWLEACCRRDLEEAQKQAEKAVQLEPTLPGHRDTLAEVLFQRGQTDEAIKQIKKCIEQDPKRQYYRRQLARFEKGDPKVEVPPETD